MARCPPYTHLVGDHQQTTAARPLCKSFPASRIPFSHLKIPSLFPCSQTFSEVTKSGRWASRKLVLSLLSFNGPRRCKNRYFRRLFSQSSHKVVRHQSRAALSRHRPAESSPRQICCISSKAADELGTLALRNRPFSVSQSCEVGAHRRPLKHDSALYHDVGP